MQNTVSYDSSVKAKPLLKAMPEEFYPVDLTEELKTLAGFRAARDCRRNWECCWDTFGVVFEALHVCKKLQERVTMGLT